ncbi:hypothetical protein GCM10025777_12290 [Membranihabitans marinus]
MVTMEWGFYGHKKINYYAVLTIPPPLIGFFKPHIILISDRGVRPDMRRYVHPLEGYKHYIDLDIWHKGDSLILHRKFEYDRIATATWTVIRSEKDDTGNRENNSRRDNAAESIGGVQTLKDTVDFVGCADGRYWFRYQRDSFSIDSVGLELDFRSHGYDLEFVVAEFLYPGLNHRLHYKDELIETGMLPYSFIHVYRQLVSAYRSGDVSAILQLSADIGHYVADAHVPLHTTSNYDGQKTNQKGIHGFWESRIPELLAAEEFDPFVGPAQYIPSVDSFIWDIVLHSYSLVNQVLDVESEVRSGMPVSELYCYEERNYQTVRLPCADFARAYHEALDNMVAKQWRSAIHHVGSVWYSAWIDGGRVDVKWLNDQVIEQDEGIWQKLKSLLESQSILGREHD